MTTKRMKERLRKVDALHRGARRPDEREAAGPAYERLEARADKMAGERFTCTDLATLGPWLFERLDVPWPIVVDPSVVEAKHALLRQLRARRPVISLTGLQGPVHPFPLWPKDIEPDPQRTCGSSMGVCLLVLKAMRIQKAPLALVLEVMQFATLPGEPGLGFVRRDGEWWFETQPAFEEKHGVKIKVRWPSEPRVDGSIPKTFWTSFA